MKQIPLLWNQEQSFHSLQDGQDRVSVFKTSGQSTSQDNWYRTNYLEWKFLMGSLFREKLFLFVTLLVKTFLLTYKPNSDDIQKTTAIIEHGPKCILLSETASALSAKKAWATFH